MSETLLSIARNQTETSEGPSEQGIPLMSAQDIKQLKERFSEWFH
jgi:hypothetical protein